MRRLQTINRWQTEEYHETVLASTVPEHLAGLHSERSDAWHKLIFWARGVDDETFDRATAGINDLITVEPVHLVKYLDIADPIDNPYERVIPNVTCWIAFLAWVTFFIILYLVLR